jgi:hypothetical protein
VLTVPVFKTARLSETQTSETKIKSVCKKQTQSKGNACRFMQPDESVRIVDVRGETRQQA